MSRSKLVVAAIIASAASGGMYYRVIEWPKNRAINDVRERLKDPDSAKFREVHYNRNNGVACGLVNAKNSMGGYVGDRRFIVRAGGYVELEPDAPSSYESDSAKLEKLSELRRFLSSTKIDCLGEPASPSDVGDCPPEAPNCSWGRRK